MLNVNNAFSWKYVSNLFFTKVESNFPTLDLKVFVEGYRKYRIVTFS